MVIQLYTTVQNTRL